MMPSNDLFDNPMTDQLMFRFGIVYIKRPNYNLDFKSDRTILYFYTRFFFCEKDFVQLLGKLYCLFLSVWFFAFTRSYIMWHEIMLQSKMKLTFSTNSQHWYHENYLRGKFVDSHFITEHQTDSEIGNMDLDFEIYSIANSLIHASEVILVLWCSHKRHCY